MIEDIKEKIIRFIRPDRRLQIKLGVIVILMIITAIQGGVLKKQNKELARVREEKVAIQQKVKEEVKAKKKKSEDLRSLTPEKQIAVIKRILEGTSYRYGVYHAVIDGEIYSTGSEIGDYTVTQITMDAITLEDKARGDVQKLYFPEYYEEQAKEEEENKKP